MSEEEQSLAHGWAISKALEATYKNHFYTVGGEVHHQTDGGPQGLDTAVEGAELYMVVFDSKFLIMLKSLGLVILLYGCYVDDLTIVLPPKSPGWHFCLQSKKLKQDPGP